jgi:hypothetical protein
MEIREWFTPDEHAIEGAVQYSEVGPFRLKIRRRGNIWDWSVHDAWYDTCVASGTAPSIERAKEVAEEVAGLKPEWYSIAA